MSRPPFRIAGLVAAAALSACSGGASNLPSPTHTVANAARTTKATFTIHWTNPTATAAMRRKDTISPS